MMLATQAYFALWPLVPIKVGKKKIYRTATDCREKAVTLNFKHTPCLLPERAKLPRDLKAMPHRVYVAREMLISINGLFER